MVHIAPAFGEDDMKVSHEEDLPVLMTVAPNGTFIKEVRPWSGKFVKDADPYIIEDLKKRGLLYKSEDYTHGDVLLHCFIMHAKPGIFGQVN